MQKKEINSPNIKEQESEESCNCGCSEDLSENKEKQNNSQEEETGNSCCSENSSQEEHDACEVEGADSSCACCSDDLLEERESLWTRKNTFIIVTSAILLPIGLYFEFFTSQESLSTILFLIVIVVSGYEIMKSGVMGLLKGNFTMNLLMSIAVIVSFIIGSGAEGALVIFLFYIAEFLEDYAGNRARKSIATLLNLAPDTATIKRNGKNVELHVDDVQVGDILVVRPGEKIPLDGVVINGVSTVDQAAITGESLPVNKTEGDEVFAATLNEEGYLEVRITKKSDETVLSKIIKLVKESKYPSSFKAGKGVSKKKI